MEILNPIESQTDKRDASDTSIPFEYRTDFSNATVAQSYKAINDIFNRMNDVFYSKNPKTYREVFGQPLLSKNDQTTALYINNTLVAHLLASCPNCTSSNFVQQMKGTHYSSLVRTLGKQIAQLWENNRLHINLGEKQLEDVDGFFDAEQCLEEIARTFDVDLVLTVMNLEYEAYACNKAFIIRGTSFEKFATGLSDDAKNEMQPLLGSTVYKPKDSSIIKAYAEQTTKPYTISFGNSLFAGSFFDCGACAYAFLQGNRLDENVVPLYHNINGYGILIDKKQYLENFCAQLFFIPGLSCLASLFQGGPAFHPRTKVALSQKQQQMLKQDGKITIQGIEIDGKPIGLEDPKHILLITRDPLKQAALFEEYIATNGKLIQSSKNLSAEDKQAVEKLAASAHDAAQYHRDLQTVVPRLKKYAQAFKEKKQQQKNSGKSKLLPKNASQKIVKSEVGAQPTEKQPLRPTTQPINRQLDSQYLVDALELASLLK